MAEPQSKGALAYWAVLAQSVAKVLFKRMDEVESMSMLELVEFSSRVHDIYSARRQMAAGA